MIIDLPVMLLCWLMLFLWQIVGFALTYKLYAHKSIDAGWGFGRLATWIFISLTVWFLGHLKLPVNQSVFIYLIFFGLTFFALKFYQKHHKEILNFVKDRWPLIVAQELIFLFFFLFLSIVRGFNPTVEGLEKFMDVGLIAGYLRSPTLPAQDMWLAGSNLNYYTFGHFMGSIVTQFCNLSVEISYNLLLGMMMGLVAIQSFSFIANVVAAIYQPKKQQIKQSYSNLIKVIAIKAGLLGSILLVFAGNGHSTWFWLTNHTFVGYWYPDATRFITNTIHEFPAYSFIVSDLHAHVWGLPIVLFLLFNLSLWLSEIMSATTKLKNLSKLSQQPYFTSSIIMGILLGLSICTSTWDFLIYSVLLIIISLVMLLIKRQQFLHVLLSGLLILILALLIASPWFLNFDSISEGARWVTLRSPVWQLLVLWGPHLLITFITALIAFVFLRKRTQLTAQSVMIIGMAITALALIILPEFVYVKDIYPNHPRANTMFKLTFQSFVLMTLLVGILPGLISWTGIKKKLAESQQLLIKMILVIFVLSVGYYAYFGYRDFYLGLKRYQTLDGLHWLKTQNPDDYAAINWLRNNVAGRPVILEAVGESYTTYARVSTFTGLPTVLGWRVHEWLWRGGFEIPSQRTSSVATIYEQPGSPMALELIKEYKIEYIIVGDKEREAYQQLDHQKLKKLGTEVFTSGSTYILQI